MKTKLKFNKKKHIYTYGDKELQSVTQFVKSFFNPFDEDKIAKATHWALLRKGIKKSVRQIKKEWKEKRESGTAIHKEIHEYITGKKQYHEVSAVACRALEFRQKYLGGLTKPKELPEFPIFDLELKLAGTPDLLVTEGNVAHIIDWKTSSEIKMKGFSKSPHPLMAGEEDCNYLHYTLQLSLYAYMLERQGFRIGELLIVQLKTDGVNVFKVNYKKELIEAMIIWRDENEKVK